MQEKSAADFSGEVVAVELLYELVAFCWPSSMGIGTRGGTEGFCCSSNNYEMLLAWAVMFD